MNEPKVIHGPILPFQARTIYSVTLLSGHVVTSPEGFGTDGISVQPKNMPMPEYGSNAPDYSSGHKSPKGEVVLG
jgi:hypothetical protein